LEPGDLVFYDTLGRPYSHVGIYLGDGKFVHAPKTGSTSRGEHEERVLDPALQRRTPHLAVTPEARSTAGKMRIVRIPVDDLDENNYHTYSLSREERK
jgi:cell wall-associated NlpC family hydrolase